MWNGLFTNISIEIGVQPSYVNGFFGLSGDLRGILICNAKIRDGSQRVVEIFTVYLNSIDPHIKFPIEQPNGEGGIPFLDTFPKHQGEGIAVSIYRKPTHRDRYLDFQFQSPYLGQKSSGKSSNGQAENICSDPDILAKEMEHLNRMLHYNNYPQWLINKWGKSDKQDPIIHPETGVDTEMLLHLSSLFPRSK